MDDFIDAKEEQKSLILDVNANNLNIEPEKNGLKRRYFTRAIWIIALIGCALSFFFLSDQPFNSMLISMSLICISSMFNLISRYISGDKSEFSAWSYLVITLSYFIAFSEIVIVVLETTSSIIKPHCQQAEILNIIWQSVYWFSIVFNFVLIPFLWVYWTQGHPIMGKRIKATFIHYLNFFKIAIIIGIILIILIIVFFRSSLTNILKIGPLLLIQVFNLGYCWIYYLILLGYGMVSVPFFFLNYTDSSETIQSSIAEMQKIQVDYEVNLNKLIKDREFLESLCNQLLKIKDLPELTENYCKTILEHIMRYELLIFYSEFAEAKMDIECDFKPIQGNLDEIYTVDKLSEMFMKYKSYIYLHTKKENLLLKFYYQIRNVCNIQDSKTIIYLNETTKKKCIPQGHIKEYLIPLKEYSPLVKFLSKACGGFLLVMSSIFYIIQIIIPFFSTFYKPIPSFFMNDPALFYPISSILFFYFIYLTICCYYTLMISQKFESYVIVQHHTDKYGMVNNAAMLNTIIFGIVYNIVLFFDNETCFTEISLAFTFLSRKTNSTIYYGVIWAYPVLVTLFIIPFLFKMKKCNCDWFFGINNEIDANEKLLEDGKKKENVKEIIKKTTFSFDSVNQYQLFLEKFEGAYYKELLKGY